jgi:hypothetical protein
LPRLKHGSNELEAKCGEWGRGASLGLAWIEAGLGTDPDFPVRGQTFIVHGEVFNDGESAADNFTVKTYAHSASGLVEIGRWRSESPVNPGDSRSFSMSCDSPDLRMLYPASPPRKLEATVEVRRENETSESPAWETRSELSIDLRHKPDLVVVPGLSRISPAQPAPGQQVEVGILVKNFCPTRELLYLDGSTVSSVDVALFELEGESRRLVQQLTLEEIPPGGGAPALFQWTAPSEPGAKRLLVVVDTAQVIDESDEENSALLEVNVVASQP